MTTTTDQIATIADGLRLLHAPGEIFEIRIPEATINDRFSRTVFGYFDDPDTAAKELMRYVGKDNIYQTLQPINRALLARSENRLKQAKKRDSQTADKDAIGYRWLPVDTDPVRPSGISASRDELEAALELAMTIRDYLTGEWGLSEPIRAKSGNGGHLLFRIDRQNEPESIDLVQRVLQHLAHRFNTPAAKVDETVFNPSRIWKVYGTPAAKGDSTPERPHRIAEITHVPDSLEIVTLDMLRALAPTPKTMITKPEISTNGVYKNGTGYTADEIKAALEKAGVGYSEKSTNGRDIFALDKCLTSDAHTDGACITLEKGKAGYKCQHNSCAGKDWQTVKPALFPDRPKTGTGKKPRQPKSTEYLSMLCKLGYEFSLSDLDETLYINRQPATDALEAKIKTEMRDLGYNRVNVMRDAYIAYAYDNKFNPIKNYLTGLKWDGTERIDALISHFRDTQATAGHSAPLFGLWLKKWMVGAIAKVYEGHQNPMLVLSSRIRYTPDGKQAAQGIGKSFFAKWLCSGLADYFLSSEINPHDKDYKKRTLNHFIWEVDELGSTTRKADVDALKSFITMPVVTIRPSYGRNDIKKRPLASFIGTVNFDGVGFLPDTTGNRRFLTVELTGIDHGYTRLDINQIWAEAMKLYHGGFDYSLSADEMKVRDENNKGFERAGVYDDKILGHYEITHNAADVTKTDDITDWLIENAGVRETERSLQMEIAKLFTREGLTNRQRPSRWHGVRVKKTD